jgi:hypothetical protein
VTLDLEALVIHGSGVPLGALAVVVVRQLRIEGRTGGRSFRAVPHLVGESSLSSPYIRAR